jgi:hypothetical protein
MIARNGLSKNLMLRHRILKSFYKDLTSDFTDKLNFFTITFVLKLLNSIQKVYQTLQMITRIFKEQNPVLDKVYSENF